MGPIVPSSFRACSMSNHGSVLNFVGYVYFSCNWAAQLAWGCPLRWLPWPVAQKCRSYVHSRPGMGGAFQSSAGS